MSLVESHEKLTWTFEEAAAVLGVTGRHLRNMQKDGKGPPTVRLGRRVMVSRRALADWLKALEQAEAA